MTADLNAWPDASRLRGYSRAADHPRGFCDFAAQIIGSILAWIVFQGAIDQFDKGHRRLVTRTKAAFEDARVPAGTLLVARSQLVKQLRDHLPIPHTG